MSKLRNKNKKKIHFNDKSKNNFQGQYFRDYYLKDFKYIGPEVLGDRKNNDSFRSKGCTLFVKMWLREVLKGFKQFLYEGSLHGVK